MDLREEIEQEITMYRRDIDYLYEELRAKEQDVEAEVEELFQIISALVDERDSLEEAEHGEADIE